MKNRGIRRRRRRGRKKEIEMEKKAIKRDIDVGGKEGEGE